MSLRFAGYNGLCFCDSWNVLARKKVHPQLTTTLAGVSYYFYYCYCYYYWMTQGRHQAICAPNDFVSIGTTYSFIYSIIFKNQLFDD